MINIYYYSHLIYSFSKEMKSDFGEKKQKSRYV